MLADCFFWQTNFVILILSFKTFVKMCEEDLIAEEILWKTFWRFLFIVSSMDFLEWRRLLKTGGL